MDSVLKKLGRATLILEHTYIDPFRFFHQDFGIRGLLH